MKENIMCCPDDLIINLHATSKCNLNCKYCYDKKIKLKDPIYRIDDLINFIIQTGCRNLDIMFYGGEPTCNIDFIEEVINNLSLLQTPKSIFQLQTNGTLLTTITPIILNKFYQILISFDGIEKTMDNQRGQGVYKKVVNNINQIRKYYNNPIIARMTLTNHTSLESDLLEAYNIFDYIHFQIDNSMSLEHHQVFFKAYKNATSILFSNWIKDLTDNKKKYILPFLGIILYDYYIKNDSTYFYCSPGYYCLTIDTSGNIFSCPEGTYHSKHFEAINCYMGNIKDTQFSPKIHERKKICKDCDIFHICMGRCIWTNEKMYCEATRFLVNQLRKNKNLIEKLIDFSNLPTTLINAIEAVEIIP
ncbi:MAG: radical SAM protein [Candidatus Hodarchaeota archaeon]